MNFPNQYRKLGSAFESAIEKGFFQLVNQPTNDKFQ